MSASTTEQAEDLGVRSASNALSELFELSKGNMTDARLQWFSEMSEAALVESNNVACTIESLATMLTTSDKSSLPGNESLAFVLYGVADQMKTISALIQIAEEAGCLMADRKSKKPEKIKTDQT